MFYENRSERLAWRVSLGFLLRSGWMTLVMSHPPDGPRCRNLPRGQEVDQAGCAICPPHPPTPDGGHGNWAPRKPGGVTLGLRVSSVDCLGEEREPQEPGSVKVNATREDR